MGNRKERKQNFCILEDFKHKRLPHDQKEFWNNNKDGWETGQLPTETYYFLTIHIPLNSERKM